MKTRAPVSLVTDTFVLVPSLLGTVLGLAALVLAALNLTQPAIGDATAARFGLIGLAVVASGCFYFALKRIRALKRLQAKAK